MNFFFLQWWFFFIKPNKKHNLVSDFKITFEIVQERTSCHRKDKKGWRKTNFSCKNFNGKHICQAF